jgi:hypothetical protein
MRSVFLTFNCGYLFLNLKGHHPLNSIKLVSAFNDHIISFDIKLAPAAKNL